MKLHSLCNKTTAVVLLLSLTIALCVRICPFVTFSVLYCSSYTGERSGNDLVYLYFMFFEMIRKVPDTSIYVFGACVVFLLYMTRATKHRVKRIEFFLLVFLIILVAFLSFLTWSAIVFVELQHPPKTPLPAFSRMLNEEIQYE